MYCKGEVFFLVILQSRHFAPHFRAIFKGLLAAAYVLSHGQEMRGCLVRALKSYQRRSSWLKNVKINISLIIVVFNLQGVN